MTVVRVTLREEISFDGNHLHYPLTRHFAAILHVAKLARFCVLHFLCVLNLHLIKMPQTLNESVPGLATFYIS